MENELNLEHAEAHKPPAAAMPPQVSVVRSEDEAELRLTDYLRVLHKRRWLAGTVFLLVVGMAAVRSFTAIPVFEAGTRLLIEADEQNVVAFEQVVEENRAVSDYYQTQYSILRSRSLARKVLDQQGLWGRTEFGGAADPVPENAFSVVRQLAGSPFATLSRVLGWSSRPTEDVKADETLDESRAVDSLLSGLTIQPVRNSRLVDIKYQSPDPILAAQVANGLATAYIEQSLEHKFLASREASDWLGERVAEQRRIVEAAESALQRYREQNDAIAPQDRENIVVQKLTDLNAAVTRAKTIRIEKEALYRQLQASQANPALLDTFPAILSNSFIQQQKSVLAELQQQEAQLSEQLGPKHPDLLKVSSAVQLAQSRMAGEVAKVVQSVQSEYRAAAAQEASLTDALNAQKSDAQAMNRKAIDYSVLQREVDSSKQMYDSLLQRAKETGVAGALRTSNIRVVDAAERPSDPVRPNKRRDLMLGALAGLALAFGLVFFVELIDSRIKTPDEIRSHLGISTLGMLPALNTKLLKDRHPLLNGPLPAQFTEAFKTMRTNLLFSSTGDGPKSLVVTSTGPGEGKSTVAANTALSLAESGQRVLLIDADMRKPKTHTIFGLGQEPGLSNLLVGQSKASEAVQRTTTSGLWVMAAGRLPPNPAELLGATRFLDVIASMQQHFDWIVIDSPPVMAVTDAALISHSVHGTIFVIGAEMTNRQNAKKALEQLGRARARIIGAVLNRVDFKSNSFYYSDYYRSEYAAYYAHSSSEDGLKVGS